MSVFVDTSALLAVIHVEDEQHQTAAVTWTALVSSGERPWTSNYVVVESVSLIRHRYGVEAVCRFVNDLLPAMDVVWVDQSAHDAALALMCSSGRGGPSMVDCASFEVIRRSGIDEVFAYDRHFREQGFTLLGQ